MEGRSIAVVYLAYAIGLFDDCWELVGVFSSKAGAYRASRERVDQMFVDHWDFYRYDRRWSGDFRAHWKIVPTQIQP